MKKSGIPRSEIFFTSKVHPRAMGYEETKRSIQSSFAQTGLDYIDLQVFPFSTPFLLDLLVGSGNLQLLIQLSRYLIHAPYGGKEARTGTWRALVEAQQAGQIRSLGVSNYGVHHLEELEAYIQELEKQHGEGKGGQISVGQWELHPWLLRPDIVEWCEQRGIVREAYCPIVRGQRFGEPSLQPLVKKYSKTAAQILIRWSLQKVNPFCYSSQFKITFFFHPTPFQAPSLSFKKKKKKKILHLNLIFFTHLTLTPLPLPSYSRDSSPFPNPSRPLASSRTPTCSISPSRPTRSPPSRPRNIPPARGTRPRVMIDGRKLEHGGGEWEAPA